MDDINPQTAGQLLTIIQRIERLEEEKRGISDEIKDVFLEAKSTGFDVAIVRKIVSLRRKDPDERSEEETLMEIYLRAIGM
jgi:uncharacterized protein (UPF0335 family)